MSLYGYVREFLVPKNHICDIVLKQVHKQCTVSLMMKFSWRFGIVYMYSDKVHYYGIEIQRRVSHA